MPKNREKNNQADSEMEAEGLPIFRANVAGIDLGSKKHWVCAPKLGGQGREVESFGATTPELERMAAWLKERNVESVAMESTEYTGSRRRRYWRGTHWKWCWWIPGSWPECRGARRRPTRWTVSGFSDCTVAGRWST